MSVSLSNVAELSLSEQVTVTLRWDAHSSGNVQFDLDTSAIACGSDAKVFSDQHFIFYNNLRSPDGAIEHSGDNLTGTRAGNDEVINVDLSKAPANLSTIVFAVSIYDADLRRQTFGQVKNALIKIIDPLSGTELDRYELSKHASTQIAVVIGELHRQSGVWRYRTIGQAYPSGLAGIARHYGVNV